MLMADVELSDFLTSLQSPEGLATDWRSSHHSLPARRAKSYQLTAKSSILAVSPF
jgi:hypothetical protein